MFIRRARWLSAHLLEDTRKDLGRLGLQTRSSCRIPATVESVLAGTASGDSGRTHRQCLVAVDLDNMNGSVSFSFHCSPIHGSDSNSLLGSKYSLSSTGRNRPSCVRSHCGEQRGPYKAVEMDAFSLRGQNGVEADRTESKTARRACDYVAEQSSPRVGDQDTAENSSAPPFLSCSDALSLGRAVGPAAWSMPVSQKRTHQIHAEEKRFQESADDATAPVEHGASDPSAPTLLRLGANSSHFIGPLPGALTGLERERWAAQSTTSEMFMAGCIALASQCGSKPGPHEPVASASFLRSDASPRLAFQEPGAGSGEAPAYSSQKQSGSIPNCEYECRSNLLVQKDQTCGIRVGSDASAGERRVLKAFISLLDAGHQLPEEATARTTCGNFQGHGTAVPPEKRVPLPPPVLPRVQRYERRPQHRVSGCVPDASLGMATPRNRTTQSETKGDLIVAVENGEVATRSVAGGGKWGAAAVARLNEATPLVPGPTSFPLGRTAIEGHENLRKANPTTVCGTRQMFHAQGTLQGAFAASVVHGSEGGCDGITFSSGIACGQRRAVARPVQTNCSGQPRGTSITSVSAALGHFESPPSRVLCRFPPQDSITPVFLCQTPLPACREEIESPCTAGAAGRPSFGKNGEPAAGGGIRASCALPRAVHSSASNRDSDRPRQILAKDPASSTCSRSHEGHGSNAKLRGGICSQTPGRSALAPGFGDAGGEVYPEKEAPLPPSHRSSACVNAIPFRRDSFPLDRSFMDAARDRNNIQAEGIGESLAFSDSDPTMAQSSAATRLLGPPEKDFFRVGEECAPQKGTAASDAAGGATKGFLGSAQHPHDCRPCAFFWGKGCHKGFACRFCHEEHGPRKKKPMKDQKNLMIIARPDGKLEFIRCSLKEALKACS
ncbi:conserved hypothetical protein [Neospora caninum Liverpool]|uniref:C3H1-type domain-containing protein n=1 Tax=Neospora caninum (strain Liverpool) TaxID=572307 RepID=F0VB72_NEOCL|nr:conserved hypothetical protein [Neospora caninum Liverpool]CBZ51409.1 conserved hypothetical protein [Neospora caninum Liverpool]CEL68729.1 TPA: hypothetical protein BN1204_044700 [Neospora caninum Liverpool]|eukprot:XP_003881442.1 conserved hypothetical protein [Neospora caninum Liverpool]